MTVVEAWIALNYLSLGISYAVLCYSHWHGGG